MFVLIFLLYIKQEFYANVLVKLVFLCWVSVKDYNIGNKFSNFKLDAYMLK
jgi:hypothetical protein